MIIGFFEQERMADCILGPMVGQDYFDEEGNWQRDLLVAGFMHGKYIIMMCNGRIPFTLHREIWLEPRFARQIGRFLCEEHDATNR